MVIPAKVEGDRANFRWGTTGPPSLVRRSGNIIVGRTVVDLEKDYIPVRVGNLSSERKKLRKGTEIAVWDYFTKWVEAYLLENQQAETVAEVIVKEFVSRFGVPFQLHSDQGRNFEAELFQKMCELLGIKKTRTTALHPQSDGMVERFNRTLENHLAIFVEQNQKDWDRWIPSLLMAYRSSVHETTKQTPACLMFGRELNLPIDLLYCRPPCTRTAKCNRRLCK